MGRLEEGHQLTRINTIDLFCSWSPLVELGRGRDHVFVSRASRAIPELNYAMSSFISLCSHAHLGSRKIQFARAEALRMIMLLASVPLREVQFFPPEVSLARAVRAPIYCRSCCIIPAGLGRRVAHALRARRVGYKFGNCALHAASNLSYYLRKTLREVASFHI